MAAPGWWDQARALSFYYLGVPRPPLPEMRTFWTGEAQLKTMLRSLKPVVVFMYLPGNPEANMYKEQFKRAAAEMAPQGVQFLQVNCKQAEEFCVSRKPKQMPWIEVFVPRLDMLPNGKTSLRVSILHFDYHLSLYGMRVFLRAHGIVPPGFGPGPVP